MTGRVQAWSKRIAPWLFVTAFPLAGVGAIWLALGTLVPLIGAIGSGAPAVTLAPRDAIGLPIGLAILSIAAIGLTPRPVNGPSRSRPRHQRGARPRVDWAAALLGVAALFCILAVVSAPITEIAVRTVLERRGYVECPPITGSRNAPLRWARIATGATGDACFGHSRDAG